MDFCSLYKKEGVERGNQCAPLFIPCCIRFTLSPIILAHFTRVAAQDEDLGLSALFRPLVVFTMDGSLSTTISSNGPNAAEPTTYSTISDTIETVAVCPSKRSSLMADWLA